MSPDYCIPAEPWERPLAWEVARRLAVNLPESGRIFLPRSIEPVPDAGPYVLVPVGAGFVDRDQARSALRAAAAPGEPIEVPLNMGPHRPQHRRRVVGAAEIIDVEGGESWFQSIPTRDGLVGMWPQYGASAEVFVFNTSSFDVAPLLPAEDYFILGSGLLGLRLIIESGPRVVPQLTVFDINPAQLDWTRFVLAQAGDHAKLDALIAAFAESRPGVAIRPVAPHERQNAERQREWYARNRSRITELASAPTVFLHADLLTRPQPVFERLRLGRETLFMYLDLFTIWQQQQGARWIADFPGMVFSLRRELRRRLGRDARVFPPRAVDRLDIDPAAPFFREAVTPCT